ncbi:MAG: phosphotransferase [Cellvibrionaceae bacterium]
MSLSSLISPLISLEETLASWQQWPIDLTEKPKLQATLSAGRSHCSFLVVSKAEFFVVRIESKTSRELAMLREQEHTLLQRLPPLCPEFVWASDEALITRYLSGRHWIAPSHLPQLVDHLRQLHQQTLPIGDFDLLDHADGYWAKSPISHQKEHLNFFEKQRNHLQKTLKKYPTQSLCHNDLIPENIITNGDTFAFIDWEYAAYNSPYFDLASLAEFGPLSADQQRDLCYRYWGSDDKQHLLALTDFRQIVRFIEWLWESLKNPDRATAVKKRLEQQTG